MKSNHKLHECDAEEIYNSLKPSKNTSKEDTIKAIKIIQKFSERWDKTKPLRDK